MGLPVEAWPLATSMAINLSTCFLSVARRKNRLYRQTGPFQFEEITEKAGIRNTGRWGAGAAMVDIDNDKDLDIYICNYNQPNELYINQGDGTFEEKAAVFGLDVTDSSLMAYFADYDNDGNLDMFLLTNRLYHPQGRPANFSVREKNYQFEVEEALQTVLQTGSGEGGAVFRSKMWGGRIFCSETRATSLKT